ncbi:MAG: hypothetical protein RI911_672 [Candidatus Parcubacteria bacterium]|jgi:hypothetical protein
MEPVSNENLLPIQAVDRMIGSYSGGINTDDYYYAAYGQQPSAPRPTSYVEVNEDGIPIVYINGESLPPTETVQKPGLTPQVTQQQQTQAGDGKKQFDVLTPSGFASTLIGAVFSIAVTIAIIMCIVVVYLIIRTRQLHHHEEHVRGVAPGGHGHDSHAHDAHGTNDAHTAQSGHGAAEVSADHAHDHDHDTQHVKPHGQFEHSIPDLTHNYYQEVKPQPTPEYAPLVLPDETEPSIEGDLENRGDTSASDVKNRYDDVRAYIASNDEVTWRHALMDIDLLLEDMLARKGIEGVDAGDRLSHADASHMTMINEALTARAYYERLVSGEEKITKQSMERLLALYGPVLAELGLS